MGGWKTGTLYMVSSFGGIIFSCVFNPSSYSVGASTAIFGLIGYYVSSFKDLNLNLFCLIDRIPLCRVATTGRNQPNAKIHLVHFHRPYLDVQHSDRSDRVKRGQPRASRRPDHRRHHGIRNIRERRAKRQQPKFHGLHKEVKLQEQVRNNFPVLLLGDSLVGLLFTDRSMK